MLIYVVGDRYQSIYSFNGTVDAMQCLGVSGDVQSVNANTVVLTRAEPTLSSSPPVVTFGLTRSFRFGVGVGQLASDILTDSKLCKTTNGQRAVCGDERVCLLLCMYVPRVN